MTTLAPRARRAALIASALVAAASCDSRPAPEAAGQEPPAAVPRSTPAGTPIYTAEVVRRWPHDPASFTEGLEVRGDTVLESTGVEGQSYVRRWLLSTGRVLGQANMPRPHFGEGTTELRGRVYQLTWKGGVAFVYDAATLAPRGQRRYQGEGWGLTHDSTSLVMSDGTSQLRWLDPETFAVRRTLQVTDAGQPVDSLNELELVKGELYANVWQSDQVARIDPATGRVTGWIDLSGLLTSADRAGQQVDVLNGIAHDARGDRLFVTGKYWPLLFEIRLRR